MASVQCHLCRGRLFVLSCVCWRRKTARKHCACNILHCMLLVSRYILICSRRARGTPSLKKTNYIYNSQFSCFYIFIFQFAYVIIFATSLLKKKLLICQTLTQIVLSVYDITTTLHHKRKTPRTIQRGARYSCVQKNKMRNRGLAREAQSSKQKPL